MNKLAEIFQASASPEEYTRRYCARLAEVLESIDTSALAQVIEAVDNASKAGRTLYICANGGSAAAAAHLVNDLVAGSYVEGHPPFKALCLSDNISTVTALGNDAGYDYIFEHQLRVHLQPGDLVLMMSVSGNSENLIRAANYARKAGATIIGFCGFDGGRLAPACEIAVVLPTTRDEYGPVEDAFVVLGHILTGYLTMGRGKWLHH